MGGQVPAEVPGLGPGALPQRKRCSVRSNAEGKGPLVCAHQAFHYCTKATLQRDKYVHELFPQKTLVEDM